MSKFDLYGWYTTDEQYAGRVASSTPESIPAARVVGEPYPNWTGYTWVMLDYTEPEITPEVPVIAPAEPKYLSVGAFFDRFGAEKWSILADTNPLVQALIKDCSVRKYINLDDPQLAAGLNLLVTAGHDIDVTAIVSAEVLASEKP